MSASNTRSARLSVPNCSTLPGKVSRRIEREAELIYPAGQGQCYSPRMSKSAVSKYLSDIARRGGVARAKVLTARERKAIATKASRAAAKARRKKAATRKRAAA